MAKQTRNYILPLGEFRSKISDDVDPVWVWIHQERVRHGLSLEELSIVAEVHSSTISRGERGLPVSLDWTRKVLKALGARLVLVTEDGVNHEA